MNWNLLFRRAHLYLGIILLPWMIVYAVSTLYFNHGMLHGHGGASGEWRTLWQKDYRIEIPNGNDALQATARRVLDENGLGGPFGVQKQGARLVIALPRFIRPARLSYDPASHTLKAEQKVETSTGEILARLHTRTGYSRGGALSVVWAVMVDLFCVATFVWVASGLYLWWKLAFARFWGWVAIAGGFIALAGLLVSV